MLKIFIFVICILPIVSKSQDTLIIKKKAIIYDNKLELSFADSFAIRFNNFEFQWFSCN